MSKKEPDVPSESRGLGGENTLKPLSTAGSTERVVTAEQTAYRGRRDPAASTGEEVEVTVDGEPLDCGTICSVPVPLGLSSVTVDRGQPS